jgi:hypothetical protein
MPVAAQSRYESCPLPIVFAGNPARPTKGSGIAIYNNNFTLAIKKLKLTAFSGTFLATLPIFAIITNSYTTKFLASWSATTIRCISTSVSRQDTYNGKNGS